MKNSTTFVLPALLTGLLLVQATPALGEDFSQFITETVTETVTTTTEGAPEEAAEVTEENVSEVYVEESVEIGPGEEGLWSYTYTGTPNIYLETVFDWLLLYHAPEAEPGCGMIPAANIVAVEDRDRNDIRLYGQFSVSDYALSGTTLVERAETAFTGCMHLQQLSDIEYMVSAAENLDPADPAGSAAVLAGGDPVLTGDLVTGEIAAEEKTYYNSLFADYAGLGAAAWEDLEGGFHAFRETAEASSAWIASAAEALHTSQLLTLEKTTGANGILKLHEQTEEGVWQVVLDVPAFLGREGLGKSAEGDQRTPSGIYRFTEGFGSEPDPGSLLPYTRCDEYTWWNSDSASDRYNQLVDASSYEAFSREESEQLLAEPYAYRYAIALSYNEEGLPYAGSGIFIHCFKENRLYTAGCISIPEEAVVTLLGRLGEDAKVLIGDGRTLASQFSS